MLHACEILFSGIVRARILAHPNRAPVEEAKHSDKRSGSELPPPTMGGDGFSDLPWVSHGVTGGCLSTVQK